MVFVFFFFLYLFFPSPVIADDTCCVGHGGNYSCNVATSQLYCADGMVSTSCSCHASPTSTPTPVPTAVPVSQTPECPANASFDNSSNACTCNSGYVVSGNSCVTYASYCQTQYGNNSYFNSASNSCSCASGYTWNSGGSACVTMDELCSDKLGSKSYFNSSDQLCYCYDGYTIQNNQCQIVPTPVPPGTVAPTKGVPLSAVTAVPLPTLARVVVPTRVPTKAPMKKVLASYDFNKKVPGLNGFVAVKKKHNGFFADLFTSLWNAIKKAFNI